MATTKRKPGKSTPRRAATASTPTLLDDETSARVLGEFLVLEDVKEEEVDAVLKVKRGLSPREIAITFRIADVLKMPDAFAMAPRFADVFARARAAAQGPR